MPSPPGGDFEIYNIAPEPEPFSEIIDIPQTLLHTPGEPPIINDTGDALNIINNIEYKYNAYFPHGCYYNLLRIYLDSGSVEIIMNYLAMCKCCIRHSYQRPFSLNYNYNYIQYNKDPIECACACKCRHQTRHLYNSFNQNNE